MKHTLTCCAILSLASLLVGCETTTTHNTPSGRPEVTVSNAQAPDLIAQFTNELINRGYTIADTSPQQTTFEKPATTLAAQIAYGSTYNPTPNARITLDQVQLSDTTRILLSFSIVTNPGSAHERITALNNSPETVQYQELLNQLTISTARPKP